MAIGITQYVNRKLSITDNVLDRNLVIDVISNASDFVTPFTLFHPNYKLNALDRNLLTAAGATGDIFECLARMDFNLTSGLEYNLLAALIEEYGLDYPFIVSGLGYDVWEWRADKSDTLFQDSAGLTPVTANSDPVGRWVDRVQGVAATQATTAAKPTYTTNSLNGKPTLAFDGGDLLATANISIGTFAVWVVVSLSAYTNRIVYEQGSNAFLSTPGMFLFSSSPNTFVNRANGKNGKAMASMTGDSNWYAYRHEYNNTSDSHTLYKNNALLSSVLTTSGAPTGTATNPLFIGARSGISLPMIGNIAHMVIVSTYPTSEIITNMSAYINGIWSVY